jgi:Ca-activated chloride channel family protein
MKRRPSPLLVLLAVLPALGTVPANAQTPTDDRPKFRSAADMVTIQASVKTTRGRPLTGLKLADFEVRDNGEPRPILSLRSDSQSPVSLVILVDTSGSMAVGKKCTLAVRAFDAVLAQLRPGEDEAAVFSFDSTLHEHRPFTSDVTRLRNALDDLDPFGSTSLYDAAAAAARRLADRSAAHKAIIVLTDGTDTSSSLTAPEVSGLASSIGVPVYVIATVPSLDQRSIMEAAERSPQSEAADLRNLAQWTGGLLLFASQATEATNAAVRLIDELRHQYVLAVEAMVGREWRRLDVRVKRTPAVVKARSGYFGG